MRFPDRFSIRALNRPCRAAIVAIAAVIAVGVFSACSSSEKTGPTEPEPTPTPTPTPTIAISVNAALSVTRNAANIAPITVTRSGGYTGSITLAASGVPTGVTVAFNPAVLTGVATSSVMEFSTTGLAPLGPNPITITASGSGVTSTTATISLNVFPTLPTVLTSLGLGAVNDRYTAEVWVRGTTAYTSTWGTRGTGRGNAIKIWDVAGNVPTLVDSLIVANASTLGDVQVSDDGTLLVVAIESNPNGGLAVYRLNSPRSATLLARTTGGELQYGVHTAEVARVNGVLYAFCAIDPANGVPARLVIVSLADPANPTAVASLPMGSPFIHDVFVRDGFLFTAEWNDGIGLWDIGGGTLGGSISSPRRISRLGTVGGKVHNVWWYQDPATQNKKYLFIGEEGPGAIGSASSGDIHVVDISNMAAPVEVARYNLPGAGVHNFSVDEANGLLYAAYYNGGVRALDVRGDLSSCTVAQRTLDQRCDLGLMGREVNRFTGTGSVYIWGVHWSASGLFASDMLNGLWRVTPATR